jgi:hypothetical protein
MNCLVVEIDDARDKVGQIQDCYRELKRMRLKKRSTGKLNS